MCELKNEDKMQISPPDYGIKELTVLFLEHVATEVVAARHKWPGNMDKLAAMSEEAGELARSMLQHKHEEGTAEAIWREAVQVAAMALRVATEGSAEMPYRPAEALRQLGVALDDMDGRQ
jgi:hypothetical protein